MFKEPLQIDEFTGYTKVNTLASTLSIGNERNLVKLEGTTHFTTGVVTFTVSERTKEDKHFESFEPALEYFNSRTSY